MGQACVVVEDMGESERHEKFVNLGEVVNLWEVVNLV